MSKYKIKNMHLENGVLLQGLLKEWIESRNHIDIINTNVWSDGKYSFATIIYKEKEYNL